MPSRFVDIARRQSRPVAQRATLAKAPRQVARAEEAAPETQRITSKQARAEIERATQEALSKARTQTAGYRKLGDLPLHSPSWYSRQATIAKQLQSSAEKGIGVASAEALKELNTAITEATQKVTQQTTLAGVKEWREQLAKLKEIEASQKSNKDLLDELYIAKAREIVASYAEVGTTVKFSDALKNIKNHPDWFGLPSALTLAPKLNKAYLAGTTGQFYFNPDKPSLGATDLEFMNKHWSVGELSNNGWYVWTGKKWVETGTNEASIASVKGFRGQGVAKYDIGQNISLYYPVGDSIGITVPSGGVVKLKTEELVPRTYYDSLPEGDQKYLYKYGIDKFEALLNPAMAYERAVQLGKKLSKESVMGEPAKLREKYGVVSASTTMPYILRLQAKPQEADQYYADAMQKIKELGVDGYNKWVEANTIELSSGELVPKDAFGDLSEEHQKELVKCGSVEKFNELHPPLTKGQIAKEMAISQIPVYYTIRSWNTSANWERALNIATDLLWIIPPARIAAGAARGAVGASRVARIARVAKAVAVAEFIAPIRALRYPIKAIKFVAEPLETLIRGSKVPIESVSQSYHTIKIPSKLARGSGAERLGVELKESLAARNVITPKVIAGETGAFYGKELEALMEPTTLGRIKPCAVAASPDIRPFLYGATIDRRLWAGPTFYERFAHATSAGIVPKGGIKGALVITDDKVLKALKLLPGKSYIGTAELEMILKTGYKLPPPSQVLFTRSLGGEKLTLLIIGPKFTAKELTRLKFIAPVETFKQIFSKPLKLTAKQTNITQKIATINRRIEALNTKSYAAEYKGMLRGDVFNKRGNITRTAKGFVHPKGGLVRRRVTGIITDDQGRILLMNDKVQPRGYFDLPGGQIDPKGKFGRTPGQEGISIEGALHGQVKTEVGFGIKDPVGLPAYRGKINPHSLPGSYVVHATPESTKINLRRYQPKGKPTEIKKAIWWDGKTEVQVSPATRDILVALNKKGIIKIDITKLKLHPKVARELYAVRDAKYANRLKQLNIPKTTRIVKEIDNLKSAEKKLVKEAEEIYRRQAVPMLIDTTDGRYIRLLEEAANQARRASRVEKIPVAPRITRVSRAERTARTGREPREARMPRAGRVPRVPERAEVPRISRVARVERVPGGQRIPEAPRVPGVPRMPKTPKTPRMPKVPKIIALTGETPRREKKFPLGSVCWRQGLFWITIMPPYRKDNVEYTQEPPRNVKVVKGPRSAYRTVTKLGFQVPERVLFDMGIMDVAVKGKGQKIHFKRDIKRRTRLGYATGVPPGIKVGKLG